MERALRVKNRVISARGANAVNMKFIKFFLNQNPSERYMYHVCGWGVQTQQTYMDNASAFQWYIDSKYDFRLMKCVFFSHDSMQNEHVQQSRIIHPNYISSSH